MWVEAFPEETFEYVPQSGALGTIQEEGDSSLGAQITTFADQSAGWSTKIASGSDATMDLAKTTDSSLGAFLQRPTVIGTYSWVMGQPLFEKFNPWALFLNDPRVAEKIANFELFRSKLHVKMVISGTSFHYGRALVSYNPYSGYDGITVERNFLNVDLIQASQKPHFFLNPTNNTGGQLDLPFFWPLNYMSLSNTDRNDMGEIVIKSMTNLQHANEGNDPVTITVYAWASDVVLTMPTAQTTLTAANYTPQSGRMDEYGQGIISAPASAIEQAAGKLTDVPGIGPYARATQIAAGAAREMAVHFGYSRPPVVSDIQLMKPNPTGNMANTDAADAVHKLSLDSKQEICIDSRTVGLDGEDQMDIKRFAQRESYLTQFTMNANEQPDTLLWNCRVTPNLYDVNGAELHPTPMAYMAAPFGRWQGSIKYRIQVVKSNFHKGRILVRWDPRAHPATVQYNTVYSRVIDLAEVDDFEITVGWGQAEPFLSTSAIAATPALFGTDRLLNDTATRYNGVLEINVLNSLVSPSLDSPIQFNVFVSACEDIKFGVPSPTSMKSLTLWPTATVQTQNGPGNPNGKPTKIPQEDEDDQGDQNYEPQSGAVDLSATTPGDTDKPTDPEQLDTIAAVTPVADNTFNVFFGEAPTSIRELTRRYVKWRSEALPVPATGNLRLNTLRDRGLGFWPGWDPNGVDTENTFKCNIVIPAYHHWFMPCYAGWRGGTRTKYTFEGSLGQPYVSRDGYTSVTYKTGSDFDHIDAEQTTKRLSFGLGQQGSGGLTTTNLGINNTIEVETPYYNGVRFTTAREPSADFTNGGESNRVQALTYATGAGPTASTGGMVHIHKSVGEDFTMFFFTGCPILYRNEISPA